MTTKEQLHELIPVAKSLGLFDAAEFIRDQVERVLTVDQSYFENNSKSKYFWVKPGAPHGD